MLLGFFGIFGLDVFSELLLEAREEIIGVDIVGQRDRRFLFLLLHIHVLCVTRRGRVDLLILADGLFRSFFGCFFSFSR